MSTGGKVDTVESLREEVQRLKKLGEWRGEERERLVKQHSFLGRLNIKERTRVQRLEEADALDKYVAALLPALLPLYRLVWVPRDSPRKFCHLLTIKLL